VSKTLDTLMNVGLTLGLWVFIIYFGLFPVVRWINEEPDYKAECIEATIALVGYHACHVDSRCDLMGFQRIGMRRALKNSLMQCKRFEFKSGMEAAEAMDGQPPSGEDDVDSSGPAEKEDSNQLQTGPGGRNGGILGTEAVPDQSG